MWRKRAALDKAITKIIKKPPYREGCYVRTDNGWQARDDDEVNADYEELVEAKKD